MLLLILVNHFNGALVNIDVRAKAKKREYFSINWCVCTCSLFLFALNKISLPTFLYFQLKSLVIKLLLINVCANGFWDERKTNQRWDKMGVYAKFHLNVWRFQHFVCPFSASARCAHYAFKRQISFINLECVMCVNVLV